MAIELKTRRFTVRTIGKIVCMLSAAMLVTGCGSHGRAKQEQLTNGIPVILKEMPDARVATVLMLVRAGSIHETEADQGISRLLERCLFRNSSRFPNVRETIESYGGELVSWVNQDFMSFSVSVEKSYLVDMIPIFSDVFQSSKIDQALVGAMKRDLFNVMNEEFSNPRVMILNLFLRNAFQRHPYRFLPLGNSNTLQHIQTEDVIRYYETLFIPENVQFIVTGSFNRKAVLERFNRTFGSFRRKAVSRPAVQVEPEQTSPREIVSYHNLPRQVAFIAVGWKAPSIQNSDTYPVDVLVSCLGLGEGSRLNAQIRNSMASVYSIWAEYQTPKEPGYLLITAVCRPDAAVDVKNRILSEIEVIKKDEVTPAELRRAKMLLGSMKAYSDESTSGTAGFLGYWSIQQNLDFANSYSKRINGVTVRDVRQAAAKYLRSDCTTSVILLPAQPSQKGSG